jgi:hypothetical protein
MKRLFNFTWFDAAALIYMAEVFYLVRTGHFVLAFIFYFVVGMFLIRELRLKYSVVHKTKNHQ